MSGLVFDDVGLPTDGSMQVVQSHELRVVPGPHPLDLARPAEIAENWEREVAANPALFNGKTILQREMRCREGHLSAEGHVSSLPPFSGGGGNRISLAPAMCLPFPCFARATARSLPSRWRRTPPIRGRSILPPARLIFPMSSMGVATSRAICAVKCLRRRAFR